jgi:hypothetical protein
MKTSWVGHISQKVRAHVPLLFRQTDFSNPPAPVNESVFDAVPAAKPPTRSPKAGQTALEQEFARIAEQIALMWGHPELDTFLARLCIDDRGNRKGFPMPVMEELMFLALLHQRAHACVAPRHYDNRALMQDIHFLGR